MLNISKGPYLQWATPQSMTIVWETTTEATGEVICFETVQVHADGNGRFHTQEETRRVIATAETPSCIQRVTIPDLQPETLYHYQVRVQNSAGEVCASELLPFKTAVNPETPFAFAVTSETGGTCSDDYNREIFQQMARYRPDFLLMVGDSVCHGRNYTDWERYFFGPARALFDKWVDAVKNNNPNLADKNLEAFGTAAEYATPQQYFRYNQQAIEIINAVMDATIKTGETTDVRTAVIEAATLVNEAQIQAEKEEATAGGCDCRRAM